VSRRCRPRTSHTVGLSGTLRPSLTALPSPRKQRRRKCRTTEAVVKIGRGLHPAVAILSAQRSALQPRRRGRPSRDLLIRPRAFVGCKRVRRHERDASPLRSLPACSSRRRCREGRDRRSKRRPVV
jgi:hypothetical protein